MSTLELRFNMVCFGGFLLLAIAALVLVPSDRSTDPLTTCGLAVAYVIASRVRFEFGHVYSTLEGLAYVPLLMLAPLPLVPILVGACALTSQLPDLSSGSWSGDRWLSSVVDSLPFIAPVAVVAALAPGAPTLDDFWVYLAALIALLAADLLFGTVRDRILERTPFGSRLPFRETVRQFAESARFDVLLSPLAFVVSAFAASHIAVLLVFPPLAWILQIQSRDRHERYAKTLELQRAYRGTVTLLSDVVEFDDTYTAAHSRSVVELVNAVADRMGIDPGARQEIEFAALLHDVGKIAVPKDILNKPSSLTSAEFEVMKRHTIEGQSMLDRVGGLLGRVGEIVRSCHERWDGGGYPDGLQGEQIPLAARIVFACDAYNAMTTDRVYRRGMAPEQAIKELESNSGSQFDPTVAKALISVVHDIDRLRVETSPADEIRALLSERPLQSDHAPVTP